MRVAFVKNHTAREALLSMSLSMGVCRHKDTFVTVGPNEFVNVRCDVMAFVGLKSASIQKYCRTIGKQFLYFDKGYYYPDEKYASRDGKQIRLVNCWRVAADETQPLDYLRDARHDMKRWDKFGPRPKEWRTPTNDGPIIIAGSSGKYHNFNELPDMQTYAKQVVAEIRKYTDRPIHYRPKPSVWIRAKNRDALRVPGTEFIPEKSFEERLAGAHAVVTHGSNAALIAMLSGIPSIIIGNGVMRLISSTDLREIETPYLAPEEDRLQLLANIAHSQYTLEELRRGSAWHDIKTLLLQ